MQIAEDADLGDLARFSARIGADPLMVQAAGGNISVKSRGRLWIKASGTWLADACKQQIMVPVDHAAYLDAVINHHREAANAASFLSADVESLRPSVETAMHAVLPHRFVAHIHCVDTIAWSVQRQAESLLKGLLSEFSWRFVPYVKPGLELASHINALGTDADVFVLGNHGLVVAADTLSDLENLLTRVRKRLRREVDSRFRPSTCDEEEALAGLLSNTGFRPVRHPDAHALAFAPDLARIAAAGTLYPDHAVFLGPAIRLVAADRQAVAAIDGDPAAKTILIPNLGIGIRRDSLRGSDAMGRCLTDVVMRLRAEDDLIYVRSEDVAELLCWDSELYRQAVNARPKSSPK